MTNYDDFLKESTIFKNKDLLSPSYIPDTLPFRENHIKEIMKHTAPALKESMPKNIFIYGKTGTGKTCTVKYVMSQFNERKQNALMSYINCRIYNSKYKILQRFLKNIYADKIKFGFGITYFYELLLKWIKEQNQRLILVLDEIDMVKDLSDLIYTFTRANDELKNQGSLSIIGISNDLKFKSRLGPRAKSSLFENELVFSPYTTHQLKSILKQRISTAFQKDVVDASALNYIAATVARENGDARFALKLLMKAGEIAENTNSNLITDVEAKEARKSIDEDIAYEIIRTLPENQQLVLYAIAKKYKNNHGKTNLEGAVISEEDLVFTSGEIYLMYEKICKKFKKKIRTIRQFSEYINDLEMLNLIIVLKSGHGYRGRTRLIKLGYPSNTILEIVENNITKKRIITDIDLRYG